MSTATRAFIFAATTAAVGVIAAGCAPKAAPPAAPAPAQQETVAAERFVPWTPATQPQEMVTDALPTNPRDAQRGMDLLYAVEIWEIRLPRDTVTIDEAFWKRVDEQVVDLSTYDQLYKNGIRVGQMPLNELAEVRKLIEERKGKRTQIQGVEGKALTIPIQADVPRQTLFYVDRANRLVGRSYERSENFFNFSFESTPRRPDRIRLALTPTVRAHDKKFQYTTSGGRPDRELKMVVEEAHYNINLRADLSLTHALVIAPSVEARFDSTLGSAFLIDKTPAEELERLIVIIPRAFKRDEKTPAAAVTARP